MSTDSGTAQEQAPDARTLLPVPRHGDMSDAQFKGTACVWCAVTLSADTAVDLGQRRVRLLDGHITVFPRACRTCTSGHIPATLERHAATCEPCVDNPVGCDTAGALRRLGLEVSR